MSLRPRRLSTPQQIESRATVLRPAAAKARSRPLGTLATLLLITLAPFAGASAENAAPPESTRVAAAPDTALARALVRAGLENVVAIRTPGGTRVAFEKRRYRHSATALGIVSRAAGGPVISYERRLGLTAAAVPDSGTGAPPRHVLYPSDPDFPDAPRERGEAPTGRTVDLLIEPLFSYELAKIIDPAFDRIELQPTVVYNPWRGGRARAGVVIPVHNDFKDFDPDHPDAARFRPGPIALDQFAWLRGVALASVTAGLLGDDRYGLSAGLARPFRDGQILVDLQADLTGFIAFGDSGVTYSNPNRRTDSASLILRPPRLDLSVKLTAGHYLGGDNGAEVEVKRAMGDVDVAFFLQRQMLSGETVDVGGVRLSLPVPPITRPVGWPVRVLPAERFGLDYEELSTGAARTVGNVASREEFLHQLDAPDLEANPGRYRGEPRRGTPRAPMVSLVGMTGFINTPWAGVMGDREVEIGYNKYPKAAAYQYRGEHSNEVYYAALGFLPRLELGLRWTVMPGAHPFEAEVPETRYTDADRMFSGRLELLKPEDRRPGLAIGIEDARGTRRFHSTYAVAGLPFDIYRLQNRVTLGYAPHVFTASRRSLDGVFGAIETTLWQSASVALEHDTEKWNTMLSTKLGFGLRARLALLDLEHLSFGAGWYKAL